METRSESDERRRARRKSEPRCCSDEAVGLSNAYEVNLLGREELLRYRGAVAERAKPVTEHAVVWPGRPRRACETRVMIGVVVTCGARVCVAVVGRMPAAQRARQDEDDRKCDKRRRAKSQRTYTVTEPSAGDKCRLSSQVDGPTG
jgi:hypothetical protein